MLISGQYTAYGQGEYNQYTAFGGQPYGYTNTFDPQSMNIPPTTTVATSTVQDNGVEAVQSQDAQNVQQEQEQKQKQKEKEQQEQQQ